MTQIKIRYTWRRKSDGGLWQQVLDISQIEPHTSFPRCLSENDLVARDLFTGQVAKEKDIYCGDIITSISNGILQYREVFWDNSWAGFMTRNLHFPDDVLLGFSWLTTNGFIREVVGSIHTHTELLKIK